MTKPEENQPTTVIPTSELLHRADVQIALDASGTETAPPPAPAPFVYNTETTEVARTFANHVDRLSRQIAEDDAELDYLAKERDRQIHELQLRFEEEQDAIINNHRQASEIAMARRADRANARGAVQMTLDALQQPRS